MAREPERLQSRKARVQIATVRPSDYRPDLEFRRSFILLRWLLIIVASYPTLFSNVGTANFSLIFGFVVVFSLSNVVLARLSEETFASESTRNAVVFADAIFISLALYLLSAHPYLYLLFAGVFLLTLVWHDLRLVMFSLFVLSVVFGGLSYFRRFGFDLPVNLDEFLMLSLLVVVAVFYVFLGDRFREDSALLNTILEEEQNAGIMLDITGVLSSSMNTDEISTSSSPSCAPPRELRSVHSFESSRAGMRS